MKVAAFTLVLLLASLGFSGCSDVEFENEDEKRFRIYSDTGSPQPILLDQETGETWQLTDAGWQAIGLVDKKGEVDEWEEPDD